MLNQFAPSVRTGGRVVAFAMLFLAPTVWAQAPMTAHSMAGMSMTDPLGVPMDRIGSGTTWIPDAVRLPSRHFMVGDWDLMAHGFVFAQYDRQSGDRGDKQIGSLNWGMLMATHELAGGRFQARTMLSLDPATVSAKGYPLLLQSGETFDGEPLHDRQHPHDFLMELAASYERPITRSLGLALYVAPSGEPALGPVAFMHRPSAMDNPIAPLAHHWQDATHVSFGVVTAGLFTHEWKLEASAFNGREPDEHRWDIDPIRLDSYSARLSFNPSSSWAMSAAYGYLKSPEALDPDESTNRVTASVLHGVALGARGQWSSTLSYGGNKEAGGALSNSVVVESEAILDAANTVLGRAELVQKTAKDLDVLGATGLPPERRFTVGEVSLGYVRELVPLFGGTLGVGVIGTMNVVPRPLVERYGSRTPPGMFVFARWRPTLLLASKGPPHMGH
jgi:hypothetical protein